MSRILAILRNSEDMKLIAQEPPSFKGFLHRGFKRLSFSHKDLIKAGSFMQVYSVEQSTKDAFLPVARTIDHT